MPHRRKPEKGSFGGHFDELVKHFPHEAPSKTDDKEDSDEKDHDVHDRLFESAWRRSREERPRAG
jgi:hypothetical protein